MNTKANQIDDILYNWNTDKNELLKKSERNISFEMVVFALNNRQLLDVIPSPTHKDQLCFVVEIENYCYIVPFVEEDDKTLFLKTIYPSRKHTKYYLKG
jgi:hypothetical protein